MSNLVWRNLAAEQSAALSHAAELRLSVANRMQAEFEDDLRATLEVDKVLSFVQVLSLARLIPDHDELTRVRYAPVPGVDGERLTPEGALTLRRARVKQPFYIFELIAQSVWNVPNSVVSVDVISDWPMILRYREHRIAHLLGAAQARIDVGAALEDWESDAGAVGETERPDAFWHLPGGGTVAVEYDSGAYSREIIRRKVQAFERFDGVIWACSSDRRRRRLRRELGPLGYQVIAVDWWSPRLAPALYAGEGAPPIKAQIVKDGWFKHV